VGRHDLFDPVLAALSDNSARTAPVIISISGPTGIGKTASAIRIAHLARDSFPDGQFYTWLGGTSQPTSSADALRALLRATGVMAAMTPEQPRDCASMLRERLADRRALLVLDDAADPDQVEQFLPGTGGCAVLITSRPVLWALSGAWHLRLPPLAVADTCELLERIAGSRRLHRDGAEALRLAEHCGGYPLAARIAAARLVNQPALPVSWLTERLADDRRRLDTLTIPGASMRSGLAASYHALAPAAQRALRRIASLASSELTASELIGLIDEDAEHAVEDLYSASLLESAGLSEAGELRYRLPGLVATYARERTDHDDR